MTRIIDVPAAEFRVKNGNAAAGKNGKVLSCAGRPALPAAGCGSAAENQTADSAATADATATLAELSAAASFATLNTPGSFARDDSPFTRTRMDELCRHFSVLVQNRSWGLLRDFVGDVEFEATYAATTAADSPIDVETPLAMIPAEQLDLRIVNLLDARDILTVGQLVAAIEAAGWEAGDDGERISRFKVPGMGEKMMGQVWRVVGRVRQSGTSEAN